MGKKNRKDISPGEQLRMDLGLDSKTWVISVAYGKRFLTGTRTVRVSVKHVPTGRLLSESYSGLGKDEARRTAETTARNMIANLA